MTRDIFLLVIVALGTCASLIGCTMLLLGDDIGTAAAFAVAGFFTAGVALRALCERHDLDGHDGQ